MNALNGLNVWNKGREEDGLSNDTIRGAQSNRFRHIQSAGVDECRQPADGPGAGRCVQTDRRGQRDSYRDLYRRGRKGFFRRNGSQRARGESFSPIERRQQKLSATIQTQTRAVAAITKPTIAAIRGYCVGGGLEFALACDMRVAAEDAKLGLAEVKRGLIPGAGGTQRLPRTVGVAKALEICLTGDNVSGAEAKNLGLVNIAVPAGDVMKAAEDLAARILKGAPMSVLFIKEAIKKGVELSLDEGFRLESDLSAMIATTEDSKEGPRAFAEKRTPVWKGR